MRSIVWLLIFTARTKGARRRLREEEVRRREEELRRREDAVLRPEEEVCRREDQLLLLEDQLRRLQENHLHNPAAVPSQSNCRIITSHRIKCNIWPFSLSI